MIDFFSKLRDNRIFQFTVVIIIILNAVLIGATTYELEPLFLNFIHLLENALGKKAIKDLQPIQPGDVEATAAKTDSLENWIGFKPNTSIQEGVDNFIKWYLKFYNKNDQQSL